MTAVAWAKVDLVTLPPRDAVQLTIYNSADLTLARESRALTLKEGANNVSADDSKVPAGYVLTSARDVAVTVAADGTANPASVMFTYKAPVTATITDDDGGVGQITFAVTVRKISYNIWLPVITRH